MRTSGVHRRFVLPAIPFLMVAVAMATPRPAAAQYTQFGQNQVQYKKFNWIVKKTDHFDVYYYKGMEQSSTIVAQMAERSYARLSRLMGYTFKDRKPIIVFASRGDFAQNNIFGDLGEETGGVTDALHERNTFFFSEDLKEVEHVMTHEMVHQFQFDIIFKGRTGNAVSTLTTAPPPGWFMEGMAEYLSIGPDHPATDGIMRDAALNGNLPTVQQMTDNPQRWFPYRYGEAFWRYIGQRWGDEIIGEIMLSTPSLGVDRAFKRHTGFDLADLGDEWKDAMQTTYLPGIASLDRPRKIAQPLLNSRKTGGIIPVYVAPALSPDGRQIAYISSGSLLKAEVFLDLYLADATTGKRIKRLTNSTINAETEELRILYSQAAFSPDGRELAYTSYTHGKDVLVVLDVKSRTVVRQLNTDLEGMVGPSWSPDGKHIVFSGNKNGLLNIYMIDADGRNLRQITTGLQAGLQPSWSPDGRKVAFVSDRGPKTDVALLKFGKWEINILDLATDSIETIPGQGGRNLNPMWAPDGKSLAYVSDRTGIPQLFIYDFAKKEHYQITKLIGGTQSLVESSPAISWARQADKLAFVYYENSQYTIWSISNPRQLEKEPYREPVKAPVTVAAAGTARDTTQTPGSRVANAAAAVAALARQGANEPPKDTTGGRRVSVYRAPTGTRNSAVLPAPGQPGAESPVSVAALLDSASLALPSAASFRDEPYHATLRPEQVIRPQVGYAQTNYGAGVYGGTGIVLGDMLGNRQLLLEASINGRIEEAQFAVQYWSFSDRLNWTAGVQQFPIFLPTSISQTNNADGTFILQEAVERFIVRTASYSTIYPLNRFDRFEVGASFLNVDRTAEYVSQGIDPFSGFATGFVVDSLKGLGSLNYISPTVSYVSDNALFGPTSPIYGHRYRLDISDNIGQNPYMRYGVDLRRYDAILFSFLTFASRVYAQINAGPGESGFGQQYIGYPGLIRGYDREYYNSSGCTTTSSGNCVSSLVQLMGTRVAVASAELRFPLVRRLELGGLPISLPPIDGLVFYDAGIAWTSGQSLLISRPNNYDPTIQRYPVRSFGYGVRMNLFGIALLRWDYSIPTDSFDRKGYWWFSLGPSF